MFVDIVQYVQAQSKCREFQGVSHDTWSPSTRGFCHLPGSSGDTRPACSPGARVRSDSTGLPDLEGAAKQTVFNLCFLMIYIQRPSNRTWAAAIHIKRKFKIRHSETQQRPSKGKKPLGGPRDTGVPGQAHGCWGSWHRGNSAELNSRVL